MVVQTAELELKGEGAIRDLRARMRDFIVTEVYPREVELESDPLGPIMTDLKNEAKRRGLWALGHPVEVGGGGLSFMSFVYLNEIIGMSEYGKFAVGSFSMQDSLTLHRYATEPVRSAWLDRLVAGDIYPSFGLTEPEVAGSDPTMTLTSARLEGDEWVIDGHKWFTSNASRAAFTTVVAQTDPEASERHRRFSAFLVPTNTPGYQIIRSVPTMGHVHGDHCEVRYTGVRIPAENLLGERGQGFSVAQDRLGAGRIFHCMRWLGQAQRAFALMCERANTRMSHGSVLGAKGEIQRYIAESAAEIQASRLMTLAAAKAIDTGSPAKVEISLIKFFGARMLGNVIDRAIQVHGALGVTADLPLERMYREARYARLIDGADEIHRMVVAKRILKDPANSVPWSDNASLFL